MKRYNLLFRTVSITLLLGCATAPAPLPRLGPQDGGESRDGGVADAAAESPFFRSGSRLSVVVERNDDGLERYAGYLFDSENDFDCRPEERGCVPRGLLYAQSGFGSAACDDPVDFALRSTCFADGNLMAFGETRELSNFETFTVRPVETVYRADEDGEATCSEVRSFTNTEPVVRAEVARQIDLAPVEIRFEAQGEDGLFVAYAESPDGMRALLPQVYRDSEVSGEVTKRACVWRMTEPGVAKCVGRVDNSPFFLDAACSRAVVTASLSGEVLASTAQCPSRLTFYRATGEMLPVQSAPAFRFDADGKCQPFGTYTIGDEGGIGAIMAEVPAAEVPGAGYEVVGEGPLKRLDILLGSARIPNAWVREGRLCDPRLIDGVLRCGGTDFIQANAPWDDNGFFTGAQCTEEDGKLQLDPPGTLVRRIAGPGFDHRAAVPACGSPFHQLQSSDSCDWGIYERAPVPQDLYYQAEGDFCSPLSASEHTLLTPAPTDSLPGLTVTVR